MNAMRNAYLDALGIDRWVPRGAAPEVAPEVVPQVVRRESAAPAPLRADVAPPRVIPATAYQRGPLAGEGLLDRR